MATPNRTRRRVRSPYDRRPPMRVPGEELQQPPPAPAPAPGGWREEVVSLSGLNVLAGIWLIIAPWVLGYSARDPRWNDVVFGAIVAILALAKIGGLYRAAWLSFVNAAIGVWLVIAAFTIDWTAVASWNDVILGVIVFLLAIGSAAASERPATERAL